MKAFVTGGTGFIGSRVIQKLVARGWEVQALARSQAGAAAVRRLGASPVTGDITDQAALHSEALRQAIAGSDVLFHIAAWYKLGAHDWPIAEAINVEGTRNILELAYELGVPKIIYTSSVAVYGDTHGKLVDETTPLPEGGPFLTEYDRTKWMAHHEVALPLIRQGAPVVIVMPSAVFGPGDASLVGEMMRLFYRGLLPVVPGPELTLAFVHVDDVADGHLLAAEKGRPGESYILAGPVFSMGEMVRLWAGVTGKRPPLFNIPARLIQPFLPVMAALEQALPLPALLSRDAVAILGATYTASPEKALRELGWSLRPLETGLRETFAAISAEQSAITPASQSTRNRVAAGVAVAAGLGLLLVWLLSRRRRA